MPGELIWNPAAANGWIQPGGPGYAWAVLDVDLDMTGPNGGGQSVESRFARAADGGPGEQVYVGAVITSNPERLTFELMARLKDCNFLSNLTRRRCPATVAGVQGCSNRLNFLDYTMFLGYADAYVTTPTNYSDNIINSTDATDPDLKEQVEYSAGFEYRLLKLKHEDISGTVSDFAINKIINAGTNRCAGPCGPQTDKEDTYWLVTDQDSTPGYLGTATPKFLYTEDGGATFTAHDINVFPLGDAVDVIKFGGYALVASPDHGVAYADYVTIKTGATGIWAQATGFSAAQPNALILVDGTVYAAGETGYIWKSTDGTSFDTVNAGTLTSNALNCAAASGCNLVWFGGVSGTLVKLSKGVPSLVTVLDANSAAVTSNINAVAVPPNRPSEIYVGCANGNIYASRDEGATWRTLAFDNAGVGIIEDIQFGGPLGVTMFIVQTNTNSKSRVLRDVSGGAGGLTQVEIIGSFDSPDNSVINSIGVADANNALTVGEVNSTYAFIGKLSA